jgi:hypothetical protein
MFKWSIPLAVIFASCNIIDPKEDQPVYLQVDSVSVSVNAGEGSSAHRVRDAWVYVNEDLLGAYEIPFRVPILEEGSKRIAIFAGIFDNGNSGFRKEYPYYSAYRISSNLQAGKDLVINPILNYHSSAEFAFIDEFEIGTEFIDDGGDTTLVTIDDTSRVFEGIRSGMIDLEPGMLYKGKTSVRYPLPGQGNPVYVEMNYSSDINFAVGIRGFGPGGSHEDLRYGIRAKKEWNKIYLNMTDLVTGFQTTYKTNQYEILIQAAATSAGGTVLLDNIKLIH